MPPRSLALPVMLLLIAAAALFAAGPARAGDFIDAAGRRVALPAYVGRVMPAERDAEVLVFALAPEKLAGMSRVNGRVARRPVLEWGPRTTPASMAETARRLGADLIIDAGFVTPAAAAFADAVTQLSGIPYILVDDSFARMPGVLRSVGAILGAPERGDDLGTYAEHAIAALRGLLLIRPADTRPRVYYARGFDGLTTALPGSPSGRAIDEAGAINVAGALGHGTDAPVLPAQLLAWDPAIIVAERRSAYDAFRRDPAWRGLAAVRNHRVYLEPGSPYGWIANPTGVNRLIGLYWLSNLFYPDMTQQDLRTTTCDFYDRFYRIKLTNARLEAMVRPAGAPPLAQPESISGPLVGLGAAPPPALSGSVAVPPAGAGALVGGAPGVQTSGPSATCAVPTAPSPQLLPGMAPAAGPAPPLPPGMGAGTGPAPR